MIGCLGLSYKCETCHWRVSSRLFIPRGCKYISVILAFVVCSLKLVTSAVGISLPLIFCVFLTFFSKKYDFDPKYVCLKIGLVLLFHLHAFNLS